MRCTFDLDYCAHRTLPYRQSSLWVDGRHYTGVLVSATLDSVNLHFFTDNARVKRVLLYKSHESESHH